MIFKRMREKRIDKIIEAVNKKNVFKRYLMLLTGCLIVAFSFNLFFLIFTTCIICKTNKIICAKNAIPEIV